MTNSGKQYVDLYADVRAVTFQHGSPAMDNIRDTAFESFKRQGFPSRRVERYRYTDMAALLESNYGLNLNRLGIPMKPYKAFKYGVPNLSASSYFIVSGAFHVKALPKATLLEGVIVDSLQGVTSTHPQLVNKCYIQLVETKDSTITALNTVLAQDGLLIYMPRRVKTDRAVQMVSLPRSDADLVVNRRVFIVLDEGAEVKFLFYGRTMDDKRFLITQVIEAYVGKNASFDLYCTEETHRRNTRVSSVYAEQQINSHFNHNVLTLHNNITRNQLNLVSHNEGASYYCNGCVITGRRQHVDNNTFIHHAVPRYENHELYKYVPDRQAIGAFAGRVLVEKRARKTDSKMRNQNLYTTKQTHMYTQSELEVYAGDVKYGHGSAMSQLNDWIIFYMHQRDISKQEAKLLLEFAFINEMIDSMQLGPLKNRLYHLVRKRFRGEFDRCAGCRNY